MKKYISILASVLILAANLIAQNNLNLSDPIPFDPTVRTGTLPNGIKYYIKKKLQT